MSLAARVAVTYSPGMGHYYRFKRGDWVIITSGSCQGYTGTMD